MAYGHDGDAPAVLASEHGGATELESEMKKNEKFQTNVKYKTGNAKEIAISESAILSFD